MNQSTRRSLFHCVVPAFATLIALGNASALAGHRGHFSDCECQNAGPPVVPCDPCQMTPGDRLVQPTPQYQGSESVPQYPSGSELYPGGSELQSDQAQPASPSDGIMGPAAQPIDAGTTSDFTDFDLSTGLAANFGGGGGSSLAFSDSGVAPGYIDSAKIQSRVRIRYDNLQGLLQGQRERAGYLYPAPLSSNGTYFGARGPDYFQVPADLDVEEMSLYMEMAFRERFSVFLDVPFRWLTLPDNAIAGGGGDLRGVTDIKAGFRWGLIDCPDEHLTVQVRTSLPTGDPRQILGTGNTSIDVSLLYDQSIGDKTRFYAELNDWQTLDAAQFVLGGAPAQDPNLLNQDANVLRFGAGIGYELLNCGSRCQQRNLTALFEVVSWTVLDGVTAVSTGLIDATGDTIVNGKYGVRYTHDMHSLYVGYGHNWTSDSWYENLFRFEWQRKF